MKGWFTARCRGGQSQEHPQEHLENPGKQGGRPPLSVPAPVIVSLATPLPPVILCAQAFQMLVSFLKPAPLVSSQPFSRLDQPWGSFGCGAGWPSRAAATQGPFPSTEATEPVQSVAFEDTADSAPAISARPLSPFPDPTAAQGPTRAVVTVHNRNPPTPAEKMVRIEHLQTQTSSGFKASAHLMSP